MRILKNGISFLFCVAVVGVACAQEADSIAVMPEQWTLQQCIDYALEKNISIQKNRINVQSTDIDTKTAKAAFFPSLNASVSQRVVNNPYSNSNTIIDGDRITTNNSKTSYNGSYGIDASWNLFNGGKRMNTLKQQKVAQNIAELTVEESENSIQENIVQMYIQILYANEAVAINEATVEISKAECDRGKELLAAGSISNADYAQLEAQYSNNKYMLVTSRATLQDYKLQLKQLLEIDGDLDIDIVVPDIDDSDVLVPLPQKSDVYQTALIIRPEIKSGELNVEQSDLDISIAKAGYYPSLSLSAGIGTNHTNGNDFTFSEQVKTNWNNSMGITLSIPLYTNRQTRSGVQKAKLQKQTYELDLLDKRKALYRTIESYWLDANSAQQQYAAAVEKLKSAKVSYDLVSEQFNMGMKNTVELLTEKNNYLNAQQEVLQAKYMSVMNILMLDFYSGKPMELN